MATSVEEILESLKSFDTDQLNDLNQVGSWPMAVKVIIWLLVFIGVLGAGYFFHVTNLQKELADAKAGEVTLKSDYREKFGQAVNLELYRKQQIEMQAEFEAILEQLPADTEIPGLIEDINNVGLQNGLSFSRIDLQAEIKHEFYIEKPIRITVMGTYHDLGAFVSDVADLSRIVTLHDFSISPSSGSRGQPQNSAPTGLLKMDILAKTYRYNDERG